MNTTWLRVGWALFALTMLAAAVKGATGHPVAFWTMIVAGGEIG